MANEASSIVQRLCNDKNLLRQQRGGDFEKEVRREAGLKFDPLRHHRRSIRLKGYDYSRPGAYFVTLCTWNRECLFGEVVDGVVRLYPLGRMVEAEWKRLPRQFPNIRLDAFVVMPNHLHGIIVISESGVRATHPLSPGIDSSDSPLPNDSVDTYGGSPLQTGESHAGPPLPESSQFPDGLPLQAGESPSGSPLPAPDEFYVRATHPLSPGIDSNDSPLPNEPVDNYGGSPLHAPRPNSPAPGSLGVMIGQFKSRATKRIWALPEYANTPIWQRNYYEHIIRDETAWCRITEYIHDNPLNWQADDLHPAGGPHPNNRDNQHG
jgi:putative transposase